MHECRAYNIFYWTMSDVRLLFRSLIPIYIKERILCQDNLRARAAKIKYGYTYGSCFEQKERALSLFLGL